MFYRVPGKTPTTLGPPQPHSKLGIGKHSLPYMDTYSSFDCDLYLLNLSMISENWVAPSNGLS